MALQSAPRMPLAGTAGISKHRYLLTHRQAALENDEDPQDILKDQDHLLADLHAIFSWAAQKSPPYRITLARVRERAPEIMRRFPQLVTDFKKADVDQDGQLSWEDFKAFFLKSKAQQTKARRMDKISVFGCDAHGQRVEKDGSDPGFMCELKCYPPLLPWEVSHLAEWRIPDMQFNADWPAPKVGTLTWHAGKHMDSPPFGAAGVCGFLRFWPAGQLTSTQRKLIERKTSGYLQDESVDTTYSHDLEVRGCCLGLVMPPGTHLLIRFFLGGSRSDKREICWSSTGHAGQVWAPSGSDAFPSTMEDGTVLAGVEVLKNFTTPRKLRRGAPGLAGAAQRRELKPPMRESGGTGCPALGQSLSLPSLPKLLKKHSEEKPTATLAKSTSLPKLSVSAVRWRPGLHSEARLPFVSNSPVHFA